MGRTIYFNFLKSYRCQNHAKFTSNLTSHSIINWCCPRGAQWVCRPREACAADVRERPRTYIFPPLKSLHTFSQPKHRVICYYPLQKSQAVPITSYHTLHILRFDALDTRLDYWIFMLLWDMCIFICFSSFYAYLFIGGSIHQSLEIYVGVICSFQWAH